MYNKLLTNLCCSNDRWKNNLNNIISILFKNFMSYYATYVVENTNFAFNKKRKKWNYS